MASTDQKDEHTWVCSQIEAFRQVHPRYVQMTHALQKILEKAAKQLAPQAIIQTRPKSISSFAEKAQRKKEKYKNPLQRMTDLCGGRVITHSQAEVKAVCEFIEDHFIIDAENSIDVGQRLKPSEFGYRSIHYIIQFKRGTFPSKEFPIEISEELYQDDTHPMKAEIQVRTVLEHAWAGFVHDRVYKGAFTIAPKWERELAVLAGMVEQIDGSFTRVQSGLRAYAANYGAYLNEDQLKDEINILESVLNCDPENPDLAHRIGKLAMELGDWTKAIEILSKYVETGYQPILRDLGVVLCKVNDGDPHGEAYKQGQKYLKISSSSPYRDPDALASLAGTWTKIDEAKTRNLFRQAFEMDPTDPYTVSNFLVFEIIHQGDLIPVSLMSPSIKAAMKRCQDQVEVGMNIPWAFYNLGMFYLLMDKPYASLTAYLQAIQLSTTDWMLETSLNLLEKLSVVQTILYGYKWVKKLLILARAVKFQHQASLKQLQTTATPLMEPVIIIAGGTNGESQAEKYQGLLIDGFTNFHGTIIGGGTKSGISDLVGRIQAAYPTSVKSIGYVPKVIPEGIEINNSYQQIYKTEGDNFSVLEPLQYWSDIISSGISPVHVKLIGINGGEISAFEYRLALMMGARVAVFKDSGKQANILTRDLFWGRVENMVELSQDINDIESFISL